MSENPGRRGGSGWLYLAGVLVVIVAAIAGLLLLTRQRSKVEAATQKLTVTEQKGPTVEVVTAHRLSGSDSLRLIGEARPFQTAIVYAKVGGYLKSLRVDKGDSVRQNEVIAVVESPETDKQYQAAVADEHNKELIAARSAMLVKEKVISQQAADQSEADAEIAKAQLEQLGTLKSYEQLRAPFAGTVTARFADPGALIQGAATSQTSALPVVEVSETLRLRIYVYVDQAHAPFVHTGDQVTIFDQSRPGAQLAARVTRTSGEIDPKTRTLLVEVDVENPHNRILAGSFVQVDLKVHTPRYVEIPSDALIVRAGQTVVATVTADNVVRFKPVVVADQTGAQARLLSGLNEGERIARNLGERVAEGSKIQPVERPGS